MQTYSHLPNKIGEKAITVSELNLQTKQLLEQHWQQVVVQGEISNLARPQSGHIYFSLKDNNSQVRCALFRQNARRLSIEAEDGLEVLAVARVSLYAPRGDYQLIVDQIYPIGAGSLQQLFQVRVNKLKALGYFAAAGKKKIPKHPQRIGLITSTTGAAVHDVLKVLKRRAPDIAVTIYPSSVQGDKAAHDLTCALKTAIKHNICDVIIVCRGGGSLEDLWAFNDEKLAAEIFNSKIPIITGIGHQVDVSIADMVADLHAATPSAAAECASPDHSHYRQQIAMTSQRLTYCINIILSRLTEQLQKKIWQLEKLNPAQRLQTLRQRLAQTQHRLEPAAKLILNAKHEELKLLAAKLNSLSPLQTLARGYNIALCNNKVITSIKQLNKNKKFSLKMQDGEQDCTVI